MPDIEFLAILAAISPAGTPEQKFDLALKLYGLAKRYVEARDEVEHLQGRTNLKGGAI